MYIESKGLLVLLLKFCYCLTMTDPKNSSAPQNQSTPPSTAAPSQIGNGNGGNGKARFSGQKLGYPNPPDSTNPDPTTLREQWKYAARQYSRWYSHAWGTAIFAGLSFFALGWIIKGGNPLPSRKTHDDSESSSSSSSPSSTVSAPDLAARRQ